MDFFHTLAEAYKEGGWGMHPILACFLVAIAIIVDRTAKLWGAYSIDKHGFLEGLKGQLFAGNLDGAIAYVNGQKKTPLTAVVSAGLSQVAKGDAEVQASMDEASLREMPKVEARTGYLAMLGNVATLSGLLGTVSGLIACFAAVANAAPDKKAALLSAGIAEAMHCTAFGLGTGIIALVAFSVLQGRTQHVVEDVNETAVSVLNLVIANREKFTSKR